MTMSVGAARVADMSPNSPGQASYLACSFKGPSGASALPRPVRGVSSTSRRSADVAHVPLDQLCWQRTERAIEKIHSNSWNITMNLSATPNAGSSIGRSWTRAGLLSLSSPPPAPCSASESRSSRYISNSTIQAHPTPLSQGLSAERQSTPSDVNVTVCSPRGPSPVQNADTVRANTVLLSSVLVRRIAAGVTSKPSSLNSSPHISSVLDRAHGRRSPRAEEGPYEVLARASDNAKTLPAINEPAKSTSSHAPSGLTLLGLQHAAKNECYQRDDVHTAFTAWERSDARNSGYGSVGARDFNSSNRSASPTIDNENEMNLTMQLNEVLVPPLTSPSIASRSSPSGISILRAGQAQEKASGAQASDAFSSAHGFSQPLHGQHEHIPVRNIPQSYPSSSPGGLYSPRPTKQSTTPNYVSPDEHDERAPLLAPNDLERGSGRERSDAPSGTAPSYCSHKNVKASFSFFTPLRLFFSLFQSSTLFSRDTLGGIGWTKNSGKHSRFPAFAYSLIQGVAFVMPAVVIGMLLNILDGVSYGMIMFPSSGVFREFGGIGISMFFVTTIISQLVYSLGGSSFAGANGSMMIEVVPFFHKLAAQITSEISSSSIISDPQKRASIIATTLAAFTLSSLLTGLSFLALGRLRLGTVVGFVPRHILVGCIGGIGVFLLQTGLTVCSRMPEEDFTYALETLRYFFSPAILAHWLPAVVIGLGVRVVDRFVRHQLVFPAFFYIVVAIAGLDIASLRSSGWLFDMGNTAGNSEPWYQFYTYFSWHSTSLRALWVTMPTQFALLFFNILHPPLNVPALAVSLDQDVDTNRELVAHGYSNFLAGLFGSVPNYLVYVNTLLFVRVGGTTRLSGFLLALVTFVLLVIGTAPVGYIPVMLVGALIFVLGFDLVKEALWDTRHRVSPSEYLTILSIVVCMTLWDFVAGVIFGIVVCCLFFVVQNSRRRSIRAMFTGDSAMSAVRRPSAHRAYIREVAKQTVVLRLQGFLFFGTIAQVEETVKNLLEPASDKSPHSQSSPSREADEDSSERRRRTWVSRPVRFLVLDLALVSGVDLSAAEALVRVARLAASRRAILVLCGVLDGAVRRRSLGNTHGLLSTYLNQSESPVANALRNVGLLEEEGVVMFTGFSEAMEWTENVYLQTWFSSQKSEFESAHHPLQQPVQSPFPRLDTNELPFSSNSSRHGELFNAADRALRHNTFLEQQHAPFSLSSTHPWPDQSSELTLAFARAFSSVLRTSETSTTPTTPGATTTPLADDINSISADANVLEPYAPLLSRFSYVSAPAGTVLWKQGDAPDGIYLLASGVLRAHYQFRGGASQVDRNEQSEAGEDGDEDGRATRGRHLTLNMQSAFPALARGGGSCTSAGPGMYANADANADTFEECMVGGTLAGELSALSGLQRNSTIVVEEDAVLWKLSIEELDRLQVEHPALTLMFYQLVLKVAKTDYDVLLSALVARQ